MTSAPPEQLNQLDRVADFGPDPDWWTDNLAVIAAHQPELAEQLRQTALPHHWRSVRGLCGAPTYQIQTERMPVEWLAGTGAPSTRAAAFLRDFSAGDKNVGLPGIAAGGELRLLLDTLSSWHAVYVFEPEITRLAAILRILPLADDILNRRCILVPPPPVNAEEFLAKLLLDNPGLLPPGNLLRLPGVPAERVESLRQICERVSTAALQRAAQRLDELAQAPPVSRDSPSDTPRLAVLAPGADARTHAAARWVCEAGRALGWPLEACAADAPTRVHPVVHAEALARFCPTLIIGVECLPQALPVPREAAFATWWLEQRPELWRKLFDSRSAAETSGPGEGLHLTASPRIAAALLETGAPYEHVAEWFLAARELSNTTAKPVSEKRVVLIADWLDSEAASCGVEQPTHKQLWNAVRELADEAWRSGRRLEADKLLSNGEARTGVRIDMDDLRGEFVRLIDRVLVPACVSSGIVEVLRTHGCEIVAFGQGWSSHTERDVTFASNQALDLHPADTDEAPLALIIARQSDPLSPALLEAGARGWPVLIYDDGSVANVLGDVLRRDHVHFFVDPAGVRDGLMQVRDNSLREKRCSALRAHLAKAHTYRHRLEWLVQRVGAPSRAGGGSS